jgi:hypothetical protein
MEILAAVGPWLPEGKKTTIHPVYFPAVEH